MNNIQISILTNHLTVSQNARLSEREVMSQIGPNVTTTDGRNLNDNMRIDLSRINTQFPGTYHGSVNVTDPQTGFSAFRNFDVIVLPDGDLQEDDNTPKRSQEHQPAKNRKKKWLIIAAILLVLIVGITACHRHQQNVARQDETNQQVAQNKQDIKSNAAANAALQKQLDDLKKAQDKYQEDHDQQAYRNRIAELENQNSNLERQVKDSKIAQRVQDFGNALNNAADDTNGNTDNSYHQASEASKMNNIWNQIQAGIYNWLNN